MYILYIRAYQDISHSLFMCIYVCFRQLLLDEDIPCSHGINSVHFFPHGSQRGQEEQLKVRTKQCSACEMLHNFLSHL